MKNVLLLMSVLFLLVSCDNTTKSDSTKAATEAVDTSAGDVQIMIPKSGCYASYASKDTFLLKTEVFPNVVTGILKYQFFEKDKNAGTIQGKLQGNKLIADYTFSSEGTTSVRQVAFLFSGEQATEGYGEMVEENNKMVFKDTSAIDFSQGMKFTSIDCVENDQKFQLKSAAN